MELKMKNFDPPSSNKVNLFKNIHYFSSYEDIYAEIIHINDTTRGSFEYFKNVVNFIKKKSYGDLFGIGMKLPKDMRQQFKVILRIFEKMFKKELTKERVDSIITKTELSLKKKQAALVGGKKIGTVDVIQSITETWTSEITDIVNRRKE